MASHPQHSFRTRFALTYCVVLGVSLLDPSSLHAAELLWSSGFENGFPGTDWHPWDNGSWSPDGSMPAGRVSAWTIVDRDSGEPVFSGDHAYGGWIVAPATESHRAYPVLGAGTPEHIEEPIPTPLVNSFMVYLDADYDEMGSSEWIHFGTWSNNTSWDVHTLSVRARKLEMAHLVPFSGEYIGPSPRPDFPLRQWVRLTAYIEYNGASGYIRVWQDGVPMLEGRYTNHSGTQLLQAHWGMYAHQDVGDAVQYNDDIKIWVLDEPLVDLSQEPSCVPEPAPASLHVAAVLVIAALARARRKTRTQL